PPVGHVDQHHFGAEQLRETGDVLENCAVGGTVLERHEDALVHQLTQPFNVAMKTATAYARSFSHLGFTNSPIFRRSEVNITSGKTANESCRLRITWLRIRSWAVPCSPKKIAVSAAGTIAI